MSRSQPSNSIASLHMDDKDNADFFGIIRLANRFASLPCINLIQRMVLTGTKDNLDCIDTS